MRWRRLVRTVLVYALLGAVATVLSSWAIHCARFSAARSVSSWPVYAQADQDTLVAVWSRWRRIPASLADARPADFFPQEWQHRVGFGWRADRNVAMFSHGAGRSRVDTFETLEWFEAGVPVPAMRVVSHDARSVGRGTAPEPLGSPRLSLGHGLELWRDPTATTHNLDRFALPLLPLWPGFLLNTLFYAVLTFALVRTPRVLRRALRRRRGRCVGCGYDRDGLDTDAACPECGARVA
ncbi:MAG: hypothetical protein NCW75_15125 [Phycisphaera sp.]|nr:MAG: hypothetical protein NCW75_15125 [Phycisphaera sp.]